MEVCLFSENGGAFFLSSDLCTSEALINVPYQLCDSLNVFAVWEAAPPGSEHDAMLTLTPIALTFVTEVVTTLTLNLAAKRLGFW